MASKLIQVDQAAFDAFLRQHPRAVPDGFRQVGAYTQTRYYEDTLEVARMSWNATEMIFEIREAT